jgi:hypothetical protein
MSQNYEERLEEMYGNFSELYDEKSNRQREYLKKIKKTGK